MNIRHILFASALLCALPAAAVDRIVVLAPIDGSNAEPELRRKAVSQLEDQLRETASEALASSGWTLANTDATNRALAEQGLDADNCLDLGCHLGLAGNLKAAKLVSGTIMDVDSQLLLTLRLIDIRSTSIVTTEELSGADVKALAAAFEGKAKAFFQRGGLLPKDVVVDKPAPPKPPPVRKTRIEPKTGLAFAYLEGGTFKYGCTAKDEHCAEVEKPAKEVKVAPFWLGRTEVPASAYEKCTEAGVCTPAVNSTLGLDRCNQAVRPEYPANCVTWEQARQFCQWIGGDLPTGEQWEFAAKDGEAHIYPWGNDDPTPDRTRYATDGTGPVGKLPQGATPAGLLDMAGNVAEWTVSDGDLDGYNQIRGGAYASGAVQLRTSARGNAVPFQGEDWIGFRCRL